MKKCLMLIVLLVACALFVGGCASGSSTARMDYNFSQVYKIAVVDVLGPLGNEGAKNQLADIISMQLLQKGYAPIERAQVVTILNEQKFQRDQNSTPEQQAVNAGKIMNVPTVIIANVTEFGDEISMSIKMLDVQDGSILWVGSGSGSHSKLMGTILGAAAGAGGGVLLGGSSNSGKIVGGVIGGVAGGVLGNMLTPEQAKAAEEIVKKICKDMPSRVVVKKGLFGSKK
ncbi:MAG: CsgG/HfaB family protein [Planctomycetaceae bacterium]|nr:CsgG/HfaB family protein [Planctomycetaceae bacterium]